MELSVREVVMHLFIFFVFADHTDGYCQWKQWKLVHRSGDSDNDYDKSVGGASAKPAAAAKSRKKHRSRRIWQDERPTEKLQRRQDEFDHQLSAAKHDRERALQYVCDHWSGRVVPSYEGL